MSNRDGQKKVSVPSYFSEFEEADTGSEVEGGQSTNEFAAMLDASLTTKSKKLSTGNKVKGEILVLGQEDVFVSTGTQNDGLVSRRDLLDKDGNMPYKVGDVLDLFVVQVKGTEIRLSPKPTAKNLADGLEDAFNMKVPVSGRVVEVCKGGFRVQVMGKLAFCPISQLDSKRIEVPEEYIGKRYEFQITQFSEGGRNIVVSRRKMLDDQRDQHQASFGEQHKEGEIIDGSVTRLEKFGAFIEVAPGIDGLAHISELSWSRIENPTEAVSIGEKLRVKILKIETVEGRLKLSLSVKQAGVQPWDNLPPEIQEGQVVPGKVTRLAKFGAFVELIPGVEGLVPLSEMSYTKRVMRAEEMVTEGERIMVMIKDIQRDARRIGLSLKDAGDDPWAMVSEKFPIGKVVAGVVERREAYGLFIRLDDGIVGLLPKSKTHEHPEFPFEKLKVKDTVNIQIAELRLNERQISLTVPQDGSTTDWKSYKPATTASTSLGTLGGAFGDKLKAALGGGAKADSAKADSVNSNPKKKA